MEKGQISTLLPGQSRHLQEQMTAGWLWPNTLLGAPAAEENAPIPSHTIQHSSPGLPFLGRATRHMSGGLHCWDDVTVYFEGHTGASVSLASHTLHVSSLRTGDTHTGP